MLLIDWLTQHYPQAKKQTLRRMVEDGRVSINGARAKRVKEELTETDQVAVADQFQRELASIDPLMIVHEDEDLLVVVKPPGLLTSTVAKERRPTAAAIVTQYVQDRQPRARMGVIHRLDRDAAGLLVFSKNHAAYQSLKDQFFHHTVDRIYMAVVRGRPEPPAGRLESQLVEYADGTVHVSRNPTKGEHAITDYRLVKTAEELSLLEVKLQTGRKHQIRAHLSERGWPIIGDRVYGKEEKPGARLLLAATTLAFEHPRTGERMTFQIAPPQAILDAMGEK